ncbi:MAG: NTP transferase domain-containing protein, partial [Alicyclobacillaceae bacterium]|nr:NTP transferase domain-containing protein [Alicyclobacillaceae bacterium]
MDAIVLTGGVVSGDGGPKALWPIRGRAMVEYVLEALSGVSGIDRLITVGHAPAGRVFGAIEQVVSSGTIVDHL